MSKHLDDDELERRARMRSREQQAAEERSGRKLTTKTNTAHSGATSVKYNPAHEPRGRQPRTIRHGDTEIRYKASTHSAWKEHDGKKHPCKLTTFRTSKGTTYGLYDRRGQKMQMFKSREAAARQQQDCKRAAGIAGAAKGKSMAKKKAPAKAAAKRGKKRKTTNAQKRARGPYCVYAPSKKLFNCFKEKATAEKVVAGMNKGWMKLCKKKNMAPKEGFTFRKS